MTESATCKNNEMEKCKKWRITTNENDVVTILWTSEINLIFKLIKLS